MYLIDKCSVSTVLIFVVEKYSDRYEFLKSKNIIQMYVEFIYTNI